MNSSIFAVLIFIVIAPALLWFYRKSPVKLRFLVGSAFGAVCGIILAFPVAFLLVTVLSPSKGMPEGWHGTSVNMAFNALWVMMSLLFGITGVLLGLYTVKKGIKPGTGDEGPAENIFPEERDKGKK